MKVLVLLKDSVSGRSKYFLAAMRGFVLSDMRGIRNTWTLDAESYIAAHAKTESYFWDECVLVKIWPHLIFGFFNRIYCIQTFKSRQWVSNCRRVLRPDIPTRPKRPEPNNQIAAGTGTAETVPLSEA